MLEPIKVIEVDTQLNQNDLGLDMSLNQSNVTASTSIENNDLSLDATPEVNFSYEANSDVVNTIQDSDYICLSSNNLKKRTLFSTLKSILSNIFAPKSHTHTKSQITDFPSLGSAASKNEDYFAVSKYLPADQDLNEIKTPGFYNIKAGGDIAINHKPMEGEAYGVVVIHTAMGEYYTQLAFKYIDGMCYKRYYANDAWSEWVKQDYAPISHTHPISQITDFPTAIKYGTDLNDVKTAGIYYIPGNNAIINLPNNDLATDGWALIVLKTAGGNAYRQTAYKCNSRDTYTRYYHLDGWWSSWIKDEYLKLTDGAITTTLNLKPESLNFSRILNLVNNGNQSFSIKVNNGGNNIDIGWDWEKYNGAGIALRSSNFPNQSGSLILFARNENNTTQLTLSPNGSITWGSKDLAIIERGSFDSRLPIMSYGTNTSQIMSTYIINRLMIGSGVVGSDAGDGASPRYFPTVLTYDRNKINIPIKTGDEILIKMPCEGSEYGVWISVNNGVTYKPIIFGITGKTPLTTQRSTNHMIKLIYDSLAKVVNIYPKDGGNQPINVTGCWRVAY